MNQERQIEIKGKSYGLLFSTNAGFHLELYLIQHGLGTVDALVMRLKSNPMRVDLQLLIWASLEGFRRKFQSRPNAFTVDEVGDLIDDAGGMEEISTKLLEVLEASALKAEPEGTKGDPKKNGEARAPQSIGKRSSPRESASA